MLGSDGLNPRTTKSGSWRALAVVHVDGIPAVESERLDRRAQEQREGIEKLRLHAPLLAFQEVT